MTQEQQAPRKRVRINISTSVKGIKTWDATVELVDDATVPALAESVLRESDWLVAQLEAKYPAPEVG